jgi:hypothetical protein
MAYLTYIYAVQKLDNGDSLSLQDMNNLSYVELDKLFEDIKYWKIYSNIDTKLNEVKRW